MRLSTLANSSKDITLRGADIEVTGLTEDSRKVKPGCLFIATPGVKQDGRAFIDDAIKRGAVAVLLPKTLQDKEQPQSNNDDIPLPLREGLGEGSPQASNISLLTAPDIRDATSALAAAFYPRQPETIAAVTGTSGKTSTAQFAREIWQALRHKSASIGTLGLVTAEETAYGSLTTPDAITLHRLLDECAEHDITHAVIEASSHGIELHRLDHVRLKAGGFTNLSRDHLDYHQTMEAYLAAKMGLFERILPEGAAAVLNADIPEYAALEAAAKKRKLKIISYGRQGHDLRLLDLLPDAQGQTLRLEAFGKEIDARLSVIGGFQAWNALCAAGMAIGGGEDAEAVLAALAAITGVPGRLQFIGLSAKGGAVFVDYAHKPDALENVLAALRAHVVPHGAKLGVIFGCGGNRDAGKRPIMGRIAQEKADWVIVSDDNPRHEEPGMIRAAILAGCADKTNVKEVGDRAKAIAAGIEKLGAHDVLVIAGKGHEPGQIVGDKVLPFDDAEEARKVLGL
ncbi:MAG: UDP-N-acetylmuramoyl-L-alanyl-D-glutamate--2,6-diaminopimelate ligase [Alphaproteobacteria bacterium]|nr:UDP-N-acetylmuramoyl-L-alanyl-D-glutamate--2,6-diaminopimelate ligase [Alphaproteobacteria bacterium]